MSEYPQFPIESLLKRWDKLPDLMRAEVVGFCSYAVAKAEAALDVAEAWAAKEASEKAAATARSKNARLRVVKSA
jgi:hypothetical protein